jgi:hypothetical protein
VEPVLDGLAFRQGFMFQGPEFTGTDM